MKSKEMVAAILTRLTEMSEEELEKARAERLERKRSRRDRREEVRRRKKARADEDLIYDGEEYSLLSSKQMKYLKARKGEDLEAHKILVQDLGRRKCFEALDRYADRMSALGRLRDAMKEATLESMKRGVESILEEEARERRRRKRKRESRRKRN